jgi:lipopolysaccharide transport system ATP-binding protein
MYVRLAFAVAAHLEPEILIVDEVLAVGDSAFQKRCIGKISDVARSGRIVLLVSHNMAAVSNLCTVGALLQDGQLRYFGRTDEAIRRHIAGPQSTAGERVSLDNVPRPAGYQPLLRWARVVPNEYGQNSVFPLGSDLTVEVGYNVGSSHTLKAPVMGVVINHIVQGAVGGINTRMSGFVPAGSGHAEGVMRCHIKQLPILQGRYTIDLWLGDGPSDLDHVPSALAFEVEATDLYGSGVPPLSYIGVVFLRADWEHSVKDGDAAVSRSSGVEQVLS